MSLTIGSLFAGIGGLELGLEWAGLGQVAWQVEIDPFCREVLAARWPDARRYEDVRTVDASVGAVGVLCGGFPCQDVSVAGKGAGLDGARSGLWFEFRRIAELLRPAAVVVENTAGLVGRGLDIVVGGLSDLGYAVEGTRIRASDLGAPHRRERVFLVGVVTEAAARLPLHVPPTAGGVAQRPRIRWPLSGPVWFGGGYATAVGRGSAPPEVGAWPTPTVKGDYNRAGLSAKSGDGLATAIVGEWATATARDTRSCHTGRQGNSRPLSEQVGERGVTGPLHPAWVEALMGFPAGWTDPAAEVGPWSGLWPMGRGPEQHPWEPPRMVEARSVPQRGARVKALGNAVVPACAWVVGCRVRERLAAVEAT